LFYEIKKNHEDLLKFNFELNLSLHLPILTK